MVCLLWKTVALTCLSYSQRSYIFRYQLRKNQRSGYFCQEVQFSGEISKFYTLEASPILDYLINFLFYLKLQSVSLLLTMVYEVLSHTGSPAGAGRETAVIMVHRLARNFTRVVLGQWLLFFMTCAFWWTCLPASCVIPSEIENQ